MGFDADVAAAERYAAGEGRTVLCYGMDVDDVLGAAAHEAGRRDVPEGARPAVAEQLREVDDVDHKIEPGPQYADGVACGCYG